jgi:signal transduction histidine kinase
LAKPTLVQRTPPRNGYSPESDARLALPESAQDHIFRIAQEALTNALKHSGAGHIDILLRVTEAAIKLTVRDDGIGLPSSSAYDGGLGRASMRHRASAIGALLSVSSTIGGGTEVRLDCPQHPTEGGQRGVGQAC